MSALPPSELDDTTLKAAQRGQVDACRLFVERYELRVFALLSRMVPPALVEDLAQDTFLRALAKLRGFDAAGPARLSTWLLTIATRLAIDELRKKRRFVGIDAAADVASPEPAADSEANRRALGKLLTAALMRLEPEARATFVLSAYHELTQEEIAAALGVEVGTVKSRLSRAKATLREAVELRHVR